MNHFVLFSCLMAMVSGQSIIGQTASPTISSKSLYQDAAVSAGILQPTSAAGITAANAITTSVKAKATTTSPEFGTATTAVAVNMINHGAEGDMRGAELRNHLLYFGIGCNRNGGGRGEPHRDVDREYEHEVERGFGDREISKGDCCANGLCEGRPNGCIGRFCNIFNCANCGGQGSNGNGVRHEYSEERQRSNCGSCFCPSELCPHNTPHHPSEAPRYPNEPPHYPHEAPHHLNEPPHHVPAHGAPALGAPQASHIPAHAPNQPPHHRPEPHHNVDPHHQAPCVDPYYGERGHYHGQEAQQQHPAGASLVVNDKTVTHTATRTSTHLSYATSTYTTVVTATKTHTDLRFPVETHTKIEHETAYQYPYHSSHAAPSPCW